MEVERVTSHHPSQPRRNESVASHSHDMASTAPKSKRTIAEDVFGGSDSELSDEEESADEQPQKKAAVASAQSDGGGQDDDDEDEDDEDEERFQSVQRTQKGKQNSDEEAYGEEEEDDRRLVKKAKAPKQRKRPAEEDADVDADGDTEMQGEERPKKKKQTTKKKQRQASPEVEAEPVELTEQEIRRRRIDEQIDAALRAGKRTKPRKKTGEDDLDIMADEEVSALRHDMMQAALDDERSNQLRQPGTAKLRLLAQVVNTLQKTHLQQSILDNNLLEGVRRWLEPLPDRSLPALNIQRQFFAILDKMQIDTISLKMSGLGKIVLFYSKCDRVVPAIRRSSEKLIETWSRPILKRSASYRDRALQSQDYYGDTSRSGATGGRGGYESTLASSQGLSASQAALARRMVSVPQAVHAGFKVAPRTAPSAGAGEDASHAARLANHQKMNRFKKSMKTKQTR